ncbi:MAG: hypothetical protein ACYCPN_01080 [Thermoplasmata archaeon]
MTGAGPGTESSPRAEIPSVPHRIAAGAAVAIAVAVGSGYIPYYLLTHLKPASVGFGVAATLPLLLGIAIGLLEGAATALKPTRLYGPLSILSALVGIGYLYVIFQNSTIHVVVSSGGLSIGFGLLILLLILITGLSMTAGIVTTVEDLAHQGERLPFDYPAR